MAGRQESRGDTSARIFEIEDVRAGWDPTAGRYWSYRFTYTAETLPHIFNIVDQRGPVIWSFGLAENVPLQSPWSPAATDGTVHFMSNLVDSRANVGHIFYYGQSSELVQIVFPFKGSLRWDHSDFAYFGGRTIREVRTRYLKKNESAGETT